MCLTGDLLVDLFGGHAKVGEIHPQNVGAFGTEYFQLGQLVVQSVYYVVDRLVQISVQLIDPLVTLGVSSDTSSGGEGRQSGTNRTDLLQQSLVLNDHVGDVQACQVEGFAQTGDENDALGTNNVDEGNDLVAVSGEVHMYVVTDHQDIVVTADLGDLFDLFFGPDTTGGVVGLLQDNSGVLGIFTQSFESFPVKGVVTVVVFHLEAGVVSALGDNVVGVVVGGMGDDDAVAGFGQLLDGGNNSGVRTAVTTDLLCFYFEREAVFHPAANSVVVRIRNNGVAKNTVVCNFFDRLDDGRSAAEVHIRNKEAQSVLRQFVGEEHGGHTLIVAPFGRKASFFVDTIDNFVKIVLTHNNLLFTR